ncbi:SCO5389 family protein [Sinosporangium siamense]|uniref:Uncharacterized protein n=1 Tax=Sinosporangium siamense TaxID=1367973 RepID=A0A919RFE1_9ACTN|nr:SCO5389 family protein [Sinosporangium siamense]GII91790.1 hypothetical protein Ssi02_20210 [Sinosporangium siamense]
MSLTVPAELIDQARDGKVEHAAFVDCVRTSLPYAWGVVVRLVDDLRSGDADFADNQLSPPDQASYGQLFRMMASDSIRGAVEQHFGVRLAFQNCCRAAVFRPEAHAAYADFITPEAQILNQRPELIDC